MKFYNYEIYFQKRTSQISGLQSIGIRVLSLFIGLIVIGILFFSIGINPLELYGDIIYVNLLLLPSTFSKFIPLCCIAVGLAIPFKARIDNIGAEGQYVVGTLAATGTAFFFPQLPIFILIPFMFINGFVAGAIWALPVALFRAKGGFQGADVVVSFLLVFPALYLMEYLVSGPWRDPETGFTYSSQLPMNGRIPGLDFIKIDVPLISFDLFGNSVEFGGFDWNFSVVHLTIFLVLLLTILIYYFIFRYVNGIPKSKFGYEMNVIGKNPTAGKAAGLSFFKVIVISMILSGGMAGIAGVGEIAGNQLRLTTNSPGYGFTAIAVAYLGGLNPIGIIISALFFSALIVGGNAIKLTKGLPGTALDVFSGIIIFFVLLAEFFFRYTIKWRKIKW